MVLVWPTIGTNGFFNGFSIRDDGFSMVLGLANHWYQWFFNGFSIRDDGFSMVSNGS